MTLALLLPPVYNGSGGGPVITVRVRVYTMLRRYRPDVPRGQEERLLLPSGSTVLDLLAGLGIPREQVQTVFVNRRVMHVETILQADDRVDLFPAIAGG